MERVVISLLLFALLLGQGSAYQRRLRYADEEVRLDVYDPGTSGCPVAILVHGASGITGDRSYRYRRFATDLMNNGVLAINVHYFHSKRSNWFRTIVQAVDYATAMPRVDASRIALVGYSLGGTLALKAASLNPRVTLVATVAGYMPVDFHESDAARLPRTYMISGTKDTAIYTLLKIGTWRRRRGLPFHRKINRGVGHTFPTAVWEDNWRSVVRFLQRGFARQKSMSHRPQGLTSAPHPSEL